MSEPKPSQDHAEAAVREALDWTGVDRITRFTTGLAFFVFDLSFGDERAVVRLGVPSQRQVLKDGLALWARLAPLGLPLPAILADGTDRPLPYVILERLPGSDLGQVIGSLDPDQRRRIAEAIADAQSRVLALGPAPGFGYAADPAQAPHARWTDVVGASLERSSGRIVAHGLFDPALAERLLHHFQRLHAAFDAIPARPFLHDTTTKNVIVAPDGTLSGIVDVDDLCYGDPRYAIGLTRAALLSLGQPSDYADIWQAASGHADDAVACFYTPLFLLDFMSEHGASFNGNQPASDPVERERLQGLYLEQLQALE